MSADSTEKQTKQPDEAAAQDEKDPWQQWLPHARKRLQARAARLRADTKQAVPAPKLNRVDAKSIDESKAEIQVDEASKRKREQLAHALQTASAEEGQGSERTLSRSRLRGVLGSVVAHVALVVILALVTLKAPGPPAGMSFASAAETPAEEIVELQQPIDAQEPAEMEESQSLESDLSDLSEQFSEISATPVSTDALGEMQATRKSIPSSSAMAATASAIASASDATFFGAVAGGNNFCYVIDGSGSMRGGPWTAARAELLKSLASLKPEQRFYIIIFTRDLELITEPGSREPASSALYATQENLEHARRWLMGVKIGNSGGPPKKAIELAIDKEPDAIYLLTDGVTSVKDVAETILAKNTVSDLIMGDQIRVPIHTIAYYSLKGQQLLRKIASENKGQFIYVPDPSK
ncbi:MAG: VWA domain-containing protein [Planctomycetota bacterium]